MMREMEIENIVVGSGAAGFQTALRLLALGEKDTALITEDVKAGTSRNTGSDKQTYYKLSLAGGEPDAVLMMAEDLFRGQCVDGDMALCEAALSVRGFYRLTELGVPFPDTLYGESMGYKTDHDPKTRATSAGPYTSKLMTEALEREALRQSLRILDQLQVIRYLTDETENRIGGVLCLDRVKKDYILIWCRNCVIATGGPAGIYRNSVYPVSQFGATGIALEAGAAGKNLTEWQFGMASVHPRWNVSGTYMQALPTFISTDADGGDPREFLTDWFSDRGDMLSRIFLKGYQWPFDVNKAAKGSSVIDLLVYQETILKGRRVFLDFRKNAGDAEIDYRALSPEAEEYLRRAGAQFGTPFMRLQHMNPAAISFYRDHGVDLETTPLEISVCAQHNNGGLATDCDWQTAIRGLYAVGEVNGSHGVTRPGGSALNAGQVGAIRASESIARENRSKVKKSGLDRADLRKRAQALIDLPESCVGDKPAAVLYQELAEKMSSFGGMIRSREKLIQFSSEIREISGKLREIIKKPEGDGLSMFYRLRDSLLCQQTYLDAMLKYLELGGKSRGSALYTDPDGEVPEISGKPLPELFRFRLDMGRSGDRIIESRLGSDGSVIHTVRPVRPVPEVDYFFENQWRQYRERQNIV